MSNQFEQTVQSIEQALKRLIDLAQETDDKLEQIQDVRLNIARDLTESNNQLERFDKILESLGVKGLKKVRQAVQMVNEAIAGINVSSLDELNTALERNNRLLSSIESLSNRARNNVNNIIAPILTATNQVDDLITKIDQLGPSGQRAVSEIQSALNSLNVNQAVAGIDSLQVSLNNLRTDNVAHLAASVTALQTSINSIDVDKLIKLTNVQAPAAKAVIEEVASETSQKKPQKPRVKKEKTASGLSLEEVKKRAADRLVEEPIPQTRTLEEVVSERKEAEDSRRLAYSIRRMIASAFVKERSTSIGADLSEDKINVIARKIAEGVVSREQGEGADSIGAFSEQFEVVIKDLERAYSQDNQKKIQALKKKYKIPDTSIGAASAIFETASDFQPSKVGEYSKRAEELRKEEDRLRGGSDVNALLSGMSSRFNSFTSDSQHVNNIASGIGKSISGILTNSMNTGANIISNVSEIPNRLIEAADALKRGSDSIKDVLDSQASINQYFSPVRNLLDLIQKSFSDLHNTSLKLGSDFTDISNKIKDLSQKIDIAIRGESAISSDQFVSLKNSAAQPFAGFATTNTKLNAQGRILYNAIMDADSFDAIKEEIDIFVDELDRLDSVTFGSVVENIKDLRLALDLLDETTVKGTASNLQKSIEDASIDTHRFAPYEPDSIENYTPEVEELFETLKLQVSETFNTLKTGNASIDNLSRVYGKIQYTSTNIGGIINSIKEFMVASREINSGTIVDIAGAVLKFVNSLQNIKYGFFGGRSDGNRGYLQGPPKYERTKTILSFVEAGAAVFGKDFNKNKQDHLNRLKESSDEVVNSGSVASQSTVNALLSGGNDTAHDEHMRRFLKTLDEDSLARIKVMEQALLKLGSGTGLTGIVERDGYAVLDEKTLVRSMESVFGKDSRQAQEIRSIVDSGGAAGLSVKFPDKQNLAMSVMNKQRDDISAGEAVLHELVHNITNTQDPGIFHRLWTSGGLAKNYIDTTESSESRLQREKELKSRHGDFSTLIDDVFRDPESLKYFLSPEETLSNIGQSLLSGNVKLQALFKDLYGEDVWDNAVQELRSAAPDVFSDEAISSISQRFSEFNEEAINALTAKDPVKDVAAAIQQIDYTSYIQISKQALQELGRVSSSIPDNIIKTITDDLSRTGDFKSIIGGALFNDSELRDLLASGDIKSSLNRALQTSIESIPGFNISSPVPIPNFVKDQAIQAGAYSAGQQLSQRFGVAPSLENQYFDEFNKTFRKRTGESLQRKDFTIQETFDWETGTTKLAASAKSASGAVTRLSAEIDQLGNVSVDVPKSGFGEAMDRIRSEIVQEVPEEIIEEFIFGVITAAQELFSAILNLQDEIAEVEILMEDARGNDLSIDTGKMASEFTIAAIEMAAATGQGFEEALKTNIQNFKVLANVEPLTEQSRIAQQLSQTQLGSQTVFGLSLDQSLESLPAIYAQMRDMIKDTDMSAAERAQQAADGLDSLMDKFVVARRETGAAGDELVQIYARLASSASDIGLDPDKLIALSASASVALGKSADETANSLKFFIERTYSQEGIKALNDYGVAVQRIGDDGVPVMRSLDDIIDDINSKLEKSPNLAKGIAQELGGRARAGEVSAIIGSRSVAERTETALKTDVQGDEFEKDIERKAARFVGSMNTLKANMGLFVQGTLFQSGILDEFGSALVKISEKFKAVAEVFINNQDTVESWQPILVGIAQAFLFMAINAGKAVTGIVANLSKAGLSVRSSVSDLFSFFDKPAEHLAQRAASAGLAVIDEFNRMGASSADLGLDFEKMAQRAESAFTQVKQDAQEMAKTLNNTQASTAYTGDTVKLNTLQSSTSVDSMRNTKKEAEQESRNLRILNNNATPDDIRQMTLDRRMRSEAPIEATYVAGAGYDKESDLRIAYTFNELGDVMSDYASTQREVQSETKQATMESVVATREETRSKKESSRASRDVAKESKGTSSGLKAMGSFLRGFTTRGVTGVPTFLQNNERLRSGLSTVGDIAPMAAMDLMIGGFGGENVTNIGAGIAGAFAGSLMGPTGTMIGYQIGQGTAEALDLYGQIGTSEQEKSSVLKSLTEAPQTEEEKIQLDTRIVANAARFSQKYNAESTLDELTRKSLSQGWGREEATIEDARRMRAAGMLIDFDISSKSVRKLKELEDAGEDISVNALNNTSFGLLGDVNKEELIAYEELKKNQELFDLYANADLSSLEDVPNLLREAADPTTELGRQFLLMENQAQATAENINQVKVNAEEFARLAEVASSGGDVELFAPDIRGVYDVLAEDQGLLDAFVAGGFESIQQALNDTTEAGKEFKRLWEDREQEELYFGSLAQTLSEIDEKIARTRSSMQTMFSMPTGLGEFGAFGTQTLGLRNQYLPEVTQIASQPYASEDDQRTLESYQMGRESLMGLGEMESYMLPLAQELNQDLEGMRQILYEVGAEGQQAFASSIQPLIEMIQFTREYEAQLAAIKAIENDPSFAPGMEGYQEAAAKLAILKEETLERKSQYEYYRAYLDSVASSPEAFKKELESVQKITRARQVTQAQPTVIKGREAQFRAPSMVDVEGYSTEEIAQALEEARKKQEDMVRMFPQMAEEFRKEQFMLEAGDQYQGVTGVSQSYFQESLSGIREEREKKPEPLQAPGNVDLSDYSDEEIQKIMAEARALQDQAVALAPDLADKYEDERLLVLKKNNQLLLETGLSQEYLQAALEDNTEATEEGLRGHYNLPGGYKPPTIWDYYNEGGTSTGDVNYVPPPGSEGGVSMDMATNIANAILEAEANKGKEIDEDIMPTLAGLDTMTPGAAPLGYPDPGTPDKVIPAPVVEVPEIETIDLPEYPMQEAEEQKSIIQRLSDKFLAMLPVTEVQESITARLSQKFTDMVSEAQILASTTNTTSTNVSDMGTKSANTSSSLVDLFGRTKDAGLSVTSMAQAAASVNSVMSDSAVAMRDLPPAASDTTSSFNAVGNAMDTLAKQIARVNIAQQLADVINKGAVTVNISVTDNKAAVTATAGSRGATGGGGSSTKAGSTTGKRPI